ncbi:hypothetical protein LSTR_LSTR011622 [Laodelphax striatellus]|uniref:Uncharacterized protein n=1 Tax=Laodelphax striatellus TaxID=195883 RepID=A0A482X7L9_LAOST|nr:hypothetical protein LSTR_LSTR011622 [Laodelphax striatellus]
MVNKDGSKTGNHYGDNSTQKFETVQMTDNHSSRDWDSDQESPDENEVWMDVDLKGSVDDGLGTAAHTLSSGNCYHYRGAYQKSPFQYVQKKGFSKYKNSLRTLIPVRLKKKEKEKLDVDSAGLLSFITFSWLSKYMYRAYRKGLDLDDIPEGSPYDSCDYNCQRLESYWSAEVTKHGPKDASLGRVVWKFIRTRVIFASVIFCFNLLTGFISVTICLRSLILFAENKDAPISEGIMWAILLTSIEILRTVFYSTTWAISYRTAARLRAACLALLYKKVVRLNSLGSSSIGQLINIFANDSQRIFDMVLFGPMIIGGPVTMTLGIFYILWLLSPWALSGMLLFIVFYPVQYFMSRCTGYFRGKALSVCDTRIRLVSEILQCIKLIKMYAWESTFAYNLHGIRKKEMRLLHLTAYCRSLTMSMATTFPIISAITTFLSHLAGGNNLTAAQAFPLISMIAAHFRVSLNQLRIGIENIIDSKLSLERFKKILIMDEVKTSIGRSINKTQAVCIANGSFTYNSSVPEDEHNKNKTSSKQFKYTAKENQNGIEFNANNTDQKGQENVLSGINFSAAKGHLVGICGHVGSGKTSLLQACLGQLKITSGRVYREGTCAFVSQQAWIQNASLRENILFGEKFQPSRYWKALNACALHDDVNSLVGGDETEIGERGINLSGGQKQRVALARALYADRDIYFLDDPLSAVDANVGAHLFNHFILEALKDKTVILVTHQIQFLNRCDEIYVLKDGQIVEKGTHEKLITLGKEYAAMVKTWEQSHQESHESSSKKGDDDSEILLDDSIKAAKSEPLNNGDKETSVSKAKTNGASVEQLGVLTKREKIEKGSINADTYLSYMKAAGGYSLSLLLILIMLLNIGCLTFSSWWLAFWIKEGSGGKQITVGNDTITSSSILDNDNYSLYRNIYGGTIGVILLTNFIRSFAFTKITLNASKNLHNQLFSKVLYGPMVFFEQTPIGRIQNLFAKDIDEVDARIPDTLESLLQDGWNLIFAILTICLVFQWFIVPLFILLIIYYCVTKIFRVAIRDLKRFENTTRSPIFSSIAETVSGLDTIHAFEKEAEFTRKFSKIFDQNTTCVYMCCIAMRWLSLRIDFLSVMVTCITATFVIVFHGQVPPALAGLAVAYSSTISGIFQYTIRLLADAETRFISVERIMGYVHSLKKEGGYGAVSKPPNDWPAKGSIRFEDVCLRYRSSLPLVLKNVSFKIRHGEKIGIVGRTGSGKSSLTVALFRLVELSSGSISINKINIASVNLDQLRQKISIIPQDPVLFTGTVRSNLDPYGKATDAELWQVLEKTHLKERISMGSGGLDLDVGQSGDKLSVGERQLLCLARALLRKSKILVLDEATAAVDPDTEAAIQETINTEFHDCTVLTIAHRLATVKSCDRINVMDDRMVAEMNTPSALLDDPNSKFSKMIEAAKEAAKSVNVSEN